MCNQHSNNWSRITSPFQPKLEPVIEETRSSPLLDLPLEIRQLIYDYTLAQPASGDGISLLRANRQLAIEAKGSLYARPLVFTSQSIWFDCLAFSDALHLRRVQTFTLRLTDLDVTVLLNNSETGPPSRPPLTLWELYSDECRKLEDALRRMPNITTFTLLAPSSMHSFLFQDLYRKFVRLVPETLPRLRTFDIPKDESEQPKGDRALNQAASVSLQRKRTLIDGMAESPCRIALRSKRRPSASFAEASPDRQSLGISRTGSISD